MKIVFFTKSLTYRGGGAERVLAQVAAGLAGRGHDVIIATSDAPGDRSYYPISESVHVARLGVGSVSDSLSARTFFRTILTYRRAVRALRPDVVVGFMHSAYVPLGISLIGSSIPVVASEHIGPEHYANRPLERSLLYLTPLLCRRITVVSEQIRQSFGKWMKRKMIVAPNPVTINAEVAAQAARKRGTARILLSVGRFTPQKDHRIAISAFARIARDFPDWTLRIVGEGDLRQELERQVEELGLIGRVELPGASTNVDAEYGGAELFVHPSAYESFGLATAEALLHGLPAVGFADCAGTNALIRDGENGRLVAGADRVQALADVLAALMRDPAERRRLSLASRESLVAAHGVESVVHRWETILSDAAGSTATVPGDDAANAGPRR